MCDVIQAAVSTFIRVVRTLLDSRYDVQIWLCSWCVGSSDADDLSCDYM